MYEALTFDYGAQKVMDIFNSSITDSLFSVASMRANRLETLANAHVQRGIHAYIFQIAPCGF